MPRYTREPAWTVPARERRLRVRRGEQRGAAFSSIIRQKASRTLQSGSLEHVSTGYPDLRNYSRITSHFVSEVSSKLRTYFCVDLRHKHDWRLPERSLLSVRIQDGHLAVVLARRKLVERQTESQRNCFQ